MSRSLKPQKVGEHYDSTRRIRVPLMLDRNSLRFFADVELTKVEAGSIEELKRLVAIAVNTKTAAARLLELASENRQLTAGLAADQKSTELFDQRIAEQTKRKGRARSGGFTVRR